VSSGWVDVSGLLCTRTCGCRRLLASLELGCIPGACQLLLRGLAASKECVEVPHKVCQVCGGCYCCVCSEGVAAGFATVADGRGIGQLGLQDCSVLAALVGVTPTHAMMGVQVVFVAGASTTPVCACSRQETAGHGGQVQWQLPAVLPASHACTQDTLTAYIGVVRFTFTSSCRPEGPAL
jgi:hypothetical protein